MGRVIRLHADNHLQILQILPWYATGQLDESDRAEVQAHLAVCPECQAEVRFQRRLDAEIEALPTGIDQGWDGMKLRLEAERPRRAAWRLDGRAGPAWLGWAAALLLAVGWLLIPQTSPAVYHVLGAAPVDPAANVLVMLHPDVRQAGLAQTLKIGRLRLIRGPTTTGAYLLQAPAGERLADLASLRRRPEVLSAEPIDSGAAP